MPKIQGNKIQLIFSPIFTDAIETKFTLKFKNSIINVDNYNKIDDDDIENFRQPHELKELANIFRNHIIALGNKTGLDIVVEKGYGD